VLHAFEERFPKTHSSQKMQAYQSWVSVGRTCVCADELHVIAHMCPRRYLMVIPRGPPCVSVGGTPASGHHATLASRTHGKCFLPHPTNHRTW